MGQPLVSVVIPVWNSADFLPATLDSILAQTWAEIEIIIVDDGSTDDIEAALVPYRGKIRYIRQDNWGGPSRPRNVAITAAQGKYISFFDSDDLMEPEKLSISLSVLEQNPQVDFIFSNFREIDEFDKVLNEDFLLPYTSFRRAIEVPTGGGLNFIPGRQAFTELLQTNFVGTSSVVCKRDLFDKVGSFDEKMLNADDVDMWRRIAYSGSGFAFVDKVLHSYRKRPGGVTARGSVRRLPAVLASLNKQRDLDLTGAERKKLEERIHGLSLGYGNALCGESRFEEAGVVFREALGKKFSFLGLKGLLKVALRKGGNG